MISLLGWMVPYWEWDIAVMWGVYAVVCGTCLAIAYSLLWDTLKEFWNE